jgi:hypothetical protein
MMRIVCFVLIAFVCLCRPLLAASDTPPESPIKYAGGDGSTAANAVIITGGNGIATTKAEHAWLQQHVPGGKVTRQSLVVQRGPLLDRIFDKLEVTLADGSEKSYFFDISSSFGKLD